MSKMVLLITSHPELWYEIAESWQKSGAPGVTIFDSYGLHNLQQGRKNIEVPPGMMSMAGIMRQLERTSRVILSIVDEDLVDTLAEDAKRILGDLNVPDRGIMVVLDVHQTIGLRHPHD